MNLVVVMLLGGLWHGAKWNFVAWGGYHGLLLAYERWRGKKSLYSGFPRRRASAITFVLMLFSWVLFRAENLTAAGHYFAAMFGLGPGAGGACSWPAEIYTPKNLVRHGLRGVLVLQPVQAFDWVRKPSLRSSRHAAARSWSWPWP